MFSCTLSWHVIFPLHLAELIRAANLTFAGTKSVTQHSGSPVHDRRQNKCDPAWLHSNLLSWQKHSDLARGEIDDKRKQVCRTDEITFHTTVRCAWKAGEISIEGVCGHIWKCWKRKKKNQEQQMLHEVCCKMCPMSNVQNKWAVSFFSSIDAAPSEQLCWGGAVTGQHGK